MTTWREVFEKTRPRIERAASEAAQEEVRVSAEVLLHGVVVFTLQTEDGRIERASLGVHEFIHKKVDPKEIATAMEFVVFNAAKVLRQTRPRDWAQVYARSE